jgi:tRNA G10  N-methylase Trm11
MDKYYKNGFLTIVAAKASRVDDGFLSPSLDAVVCDVPYAKSDAILYTAGLSYNTQDLDQTGSMAASK